MVTKKVIKVIASILTAAFLCQLPVLALQDRPDQVPNRVPRNADPIDVSINQLKTLARVTAGIHLTQLLINGTGKVDEIAAELLMTEPVTPTQISNFTATELETAIHSIKSLQEELGSSAGVQAVESNWKLMIKVNKMLDGITDYKQWPSKNDFKTAIDKLKNNGVDFVKANQLSSEINGLSVNFDLLGDDLSYYDIVQSSVTSIVSKIGQLKWDMFKFSDKGTATELSYVPVNIANSALKNRNLTENYATVDINDSKDNIIRFLNAGATFGQLKAKFTLITELINSRKTFGASRLLNYTTGLPNGYSDLTSLSADVNSPWMVEIANSSKLDYAIESLKQLSTPMAGFTNKMTSIANKSDSVYKVFSEVSDFLALSLKMAEGTAAVNKLKHCFRPAALTPDIAAVTTIETAAQLIDETFDAINALQKEDVVTKLNQLAAVCDKAKLPNANLTQLKAEADKYKPFITFLRGIGPKLAVHVSSFRSSVSAAADAVDKVQAALDGLTAFHTLFGCVKINNLDVITNTISMIERYRLKKGDTKRFDETVSVSKEIASTSSDLTTIKSTMSGLKGKGTSESKLLNLLKDPKKTVTSITKSVQAVVLMDEVIKKKSDVENVIQHLDLIAQELPNNFDPTDTATLTALVGLNSSFQSMMASLDTWHSAVKGKTLKTLDDAKGVFTPAKSVTGVQGDLDAMTAALGRLVRTVPNSANKPALDNLYASLQTANMLHLDFSSFSTALADVDQSINYLKQFFSGFAAAPHATDSSRNPLSKGDRQLNVTLNQKSDGGGIDKTVYQSIIGGTIVVLVVSAVFAGWCYYCLRKKNAELKEEVERLTNEANEREEENNEHVLKGADEGLRLVEMRKDFVPLSISPAPQAPLEHDEATNAGGTAEISLLAPVTFSMKRIKGFLAKFLKLMVEKRSDEKDKETELRRNKMCDEDVINEKMRLTYTIFHKYLEFVAKGTAEKSAGDGAIVRANAHLSRYMMTLTLKTRITVTGFETDFLHANVVQCGNSGLSLIALQGPLGLTGEKKGKSETCARTWQAFRQKEVMDIVMLCQFHEGENKEQKCGKYFPEELNQQIEFDNVRVKCIKVKKLLGKDLGIPKDKQVHVIFRRFHVLYVRELTARYFNHYQHVQWPDHGIPEHKEPLLWLLRKVDCVKNPVAVHCSAGIGRTGVFAFVLYAAQLINSGILDNNLYALLLDLRRQRSQLVQTVEQLGFALELLVDYMINGRNDELDETAKSNHELLKRCFELMSKENVKAAGFKDILEQKPDIKVDPKDADCRKLLVNLDELNEPKTSGTSGTSGTSSSTTPTSSGNAKGKKAKKEKAKKEKPKKETSKNAKKEKAKKAKKNK